MKKQLLLLLACFAYSILNAQTFTNYLREGNYIFNDTNKVLLTTILSVIF